ncbi:FAD-binding oxidoreductase [Patescibacteria group bacterium]|nr:FAD-binding oxidoreductase [Patescibacteria group bacterium]MBU4162225.1 FAD-binding oxidoreductase [Patescibacteria group bacterium]
MKNNHKAVQKVDCIIIGAGIFGLYAASLLVKKGKKVAIVDKSTKPFSRASAINQARVHSGYHYPRSYETAEKVAYHYNRFVRDFDFAINNSFEQIYAIASNGSKTSAQDFVSFCEKVNIPLKKVNADLYFKKGSAEAAFIAQECSFDFIKIRDFLVDKVRTSAHCYYGTGIQSVEKRNPSYIVALDNGICLSAPFVINASYAGINEVIDKFNHQFFDLKYELCEIVLCEVPKEFKNLGITVMDGDFFSVVPFGNSDFHALTSVGHTPHDVSYDKIPNFRNKAERSICKMHGVSECVVCSQNLKSAWSKMYKLSRVFLKPNFKIEYKHSKFEIKAILKASENDDSRPTIIKQHTIDPTFVSVLSGKISTIYDLENICKQPEYSETLATKVSFISK